MAVSCQNLPLGALSSRSAPSVLVGELFKKCGLFLNTGVFNRVVIKCTVLFSLRICVVCKITLDLTLPHKISTIFNY